MNVDELKKYVTNSCVRGTPITPGQATALIDALNNVKEPEGDRFTEEDLFFNFFDYEATFDDGELGRAFYEADKRGLSVSLVLVNGEYNVDTPGAWTEVGYACDDIDQAVRTIFALCYEHDTHADLSHLKGDRGL